MKPDLKTPAKKFRFKPVLPYMVFGLFIFILFVTSSLSSRPPEIEEVLPEVGATGDELVIIGKYFGTNRNGGKVVVNDVSPPYLSYQWNDERISFIVPQEMVGGLVKVVTRHGVSREVALFTNGYYLPLVVSGPVNPGEPYIVAIEPNTGPVGTRITVKGQNFGLERGDSKVSFAWISGSQIGAYEGAEDANWIAALEYDHDYGPWDDRELKVRVPDGASSGTLRVVTDKGESNAVYFEVNDLAGTKIFGKRRTLHVRYSVDINSVDAEHDNGLYIWVPRLKETPEQREIDLISAEPEPFFFNYEDFMLFFLENLGDGERYKVSLEFIFKRYEVETKVNAFKVKNYYDKTNKLYLRYTQPSSTVPSSHERIAALLPYVVGNETNPFTKAWLIYHYVANRLSYIESPEEKDVVKAIDTQEGDAYDYAILFCALARNSGIPARPVAGYLVVSGTKSIKHYWAEFYIDNVGWIPVDPLLGDEKKFGDFPGEMKTNARDYYFGNLDNYHITFSKGLVVLKQMNPNGRVVRREGTASFQTIHEEYIGNLKGYSSHWNDLQLVGVY